VCPRERLVIISYTTGLSFAEERIGPLAAIVTTVLYLLALYLLILPNTPENLFASIYSESLIKTTHQHLLLLVGFDTLIIESTTIHPLYLWVISNSSNPIIIDGAYSLWKDKFGNVFAKCVGAQCGLKKRNIWVAKPIVTNFLVPNLVGDHQVKTWSIGVYWRALETWLYYKELRDLHQLYCLKSS
jgi:hypothetical protein